MSMTERRFGVAVFVSMLLLLAFTGFTGYRAAAFARCQAHYNDVNNERTRILTDVGASERDAQRARDDALDATLLDPSLLRPPDERTPAEQQRVRDLFLAYVRAADALRAERAKADAARAANPVPPPPSQICS